MSPPPASLWRHLQNSSIHLLCPNYASAVALIIEEMGCKPPHVATDKIDIDQVWKSFHCVHPLGRTVKLYAGEEPLTIIEHLRWRIGP